MIAYNSRIKKIVSKDKKFIVYVEGSQNSSIKCNYLINSAGIFASDVAHLIEELDQKYIPKTFYAKGNYFSTGKKLGFNHLIYPIPEGFGLGIHLTLELDHTVKFGPDVEWVDNPNDYNVNVDRKHYFLKEILKYFPSFDKNLLQPSYAGIRPILNKKDKSMRDFKIQSFSDHSIPNLINLYGIESPGLTSSLSLAKYVSEIL